MQILERIIAPTAILVTLGYFFGRQYTGAVVSYFGVEVSALEMSPDEFVLRSADAIFIPLATLAVVGLMMMYLHVRVVLPVVSRCAAHPPGSVQQRRFQRSRQLLQLLGFVAFGYGIAGRFVPVPGLDPAYLPSIVSAFGVLAVTYGEGLRDAERAGGSGLIRWRDHPNAATVARFLVGAFVAFNVFFAVSSYAQRVGTLRAEFLAANLPSRPAATVYSTEDLALTGPGVVGAALPGSYFKFRYHGLRLLSLSGSNYLLLPARWTPAAGPAFLLQKSDKIRIEFG